MAQAKPTLDTVWGSTGATTNPGATKMNLGWTSEIPTHQVQNFWQQRSDEMLTHLNEQGIAEWDAATTYPLDAWAKGSDGEVYRALQVATAQDPISAPTYWTTNITAAGAQSLADPGYVTFAGGLIMQWTSVSAAIDTTGIPVVFPITFPTAAFSVTGTAEDPIVGTVGEEGVTAYNPTVSGCTVDNGKNAITQVRVIALGH